MSAALAMTKHNGSCQYLAEQEEEGPPIASSYNMITPDMMFTLMKRKRSLDVF